MRTIPWEELSHLVWIDAFLEIDWEHNNGLPDSPVFRATLDEDEDTADLTPPDDA